MEKLTEKQYKSLVEAYSAVYNEDHQSELNEEQQINEFLEVVNSLVEEGYDLSEYTYDELYENWKAQLSKYLGDTALKYGMKGLEAGKQSIKSLLSPIGHVFQGTLGDKSLLRKPIPAAIVGGAAALYAASKGGIPNISAPQMPSIPTVKPTPTPTKPKKSESLPGFESFDSFDLIKGHLLDEGYADTEEAALAIMSNMSEEWREDILNEAAKDQSDKQIEKGVKTTYKGGNVLDNTHQGRSPGLSRLPRGEREEKQKRMRGRLKTRRDDLFGERNKREDAARAELKKKYGL